MVLAGFVVFIGCASTGAGKVAGGKTGTATASAQGFHGLVTVTITVENGKLVSAAADGPGETPGIGQRAITSLPDQMVQKNTVEVDGLSGATLTANAILEAAKAAEAEIAGK